MPQQTSKTRSGRAERRFRPGADEGQLELASASQLETRTLLSHTAHWAQVAMHASAHSTQEDLINTYYDNFRHFSDTSIMTGTFFNDSYIINSTNQMAINLVREFNSRPLKLKLPYLNAPPHTPNNRGAIQTFIYDSIAGSSATSLQQSLLAIPTANNSQYQATFDAAIEQSRSQTLNGVSEIYAKQLYISAPQPNNRFGVIAPKTIPAYYLAY